MEAKQQNRSGSDQPRNVEIQNHAVILSEAIWQLQNHQIYVCWENPEAGSRADENAVRTQIENTWARHSSLRFTGWQKCAQVNRGIRILIEDSGPHTKGLGRTLDGVPNGMVLNFTFKNWSPSCRSMREYCISSIAVHEFGHALGFAHEQNSPKAPGECQLRKQGSDGDLLLTPYDPSSVMNYCNQKYNNDGNLSVLDIEAIQTLYGMP